MIVTRPRRDPEHTQLVTKLRRGICPPGGAASASGSARGRVLSPGTQQREHEIPCGRVKWNGVVSQKHWLRAALWRGKPDLGLRVATAV
jgi:hypothetical protein